MLKHITAEEAPSSIKQLFKTQGDTVIEIYEGKSIKRHKPMVCPICRDVFYGYGDANDVYAVPEVQMEKDPDGQGIRRPRSTCGNITCYDAEWHYAFRSSPWYTSRMESMKENDVSKQNRALSDSRRELFGEK